MEDVIKKVAYLDQLEIYVTNKLTNDLPDKMVYHDIEHTHRLVVAIKEIGAAEGISDEEKELCVMAGWLTNLGFIDIDHQEVKDTQDFFEKCRKSSIHLGTLFLREIGLPSEKIAHIISIMQDGGFGKASKTKLGAILNDAASSDWARPQGKKRLKRLYEELLLTGVISLGKSTWYDAVISFLNKHQYQTAYGKAYLAPKKDQLIAKVEKEKKNIEKAENQIIRKEMEISDEELKKLKKSLSSVTGRDERGIQTMFRTTSRNHYTISQMIDRKANIMISINAILLSLIMSRIIGKMETFCIHNSPIIVILIFSTFSIACAIFAITPPRTHGKFEERTVRNKEGNLLYFGNFHNMKLRDYEWGMLQMLNDHNYLYGSMIRDLYFLGQSLKLKSKLIRFSLGTFVAGLCIAVIAFIIVSGMSDFHFGTATH